MNFDPSLPTSYEYIHYTGENIAALDLTRTYTQTAEKLALHTPNGLWLSITGINDWEKYCLTNYYNLTNLKYEFQVKLKPQAKILILYNNAAFEDFEKKYGYNGKNHTSGLSIRWDEIIKNYQGFALPVVLPKSNNTGSWHDTWNCTSACIWDLQAVERFDRLEQ